MDINTKLNSIKDTIDDIMRSSAYRRARQDLAAQAQVISRIAFCAGELNCCKVELQSIIRHESLLWRQAKQLGFANEMQDALVWEASVKYMLVEEAIFFLNSTSDFDRLQCACKHITNVIGQMDGAGAYWGLFRRGEKIARPLIGEMFEENAVSAKSKYLNEFYKNVLATGDIERCLNEERKTGHLKAYEDVPNPDPAPVPKPKVQDYVDDDEEPTTMDPDEFVDTVETEEDDEEDDKIPYIIDSRPPDIKR